jgi:hypothetical protein
MVIAGSQKYCWGTVLAKRRPPEYGAVSQVQVCYLPEFPRTSLLTLIRLQPRALHCSQSSFFVEELSNFRIAQGNMSSSFCIVPSQEAVLLLSLSLRVDNEDHGLKSHSGDVRAARRNPVGLCKLGLRGTGNAAAATGEELEMKVG